MASGHDFQKWFLQQSEEGLTLVGKFCLGHNINSCVTVISFYTFSLLPQQTWMPISLQKTIRRSCYKPQGRQYGFGAHPQNTALKELQLSTLYFPRNPYVDGCVHDQSWCTLTRKSIYWENLSKRDQR